MKNFTTSPAVSRNYSTVLKIPYCALQSLLSHETPVSYNRGLYGWNYDVYAVDGVAIVTGYRNMPGARVPDSIINDVESRARVLCKTSVEYESTRAALRVMINQLIRRAANS